MLRHEDHTLGSGVRLVYFNVLYQGGRHRIPGQLQTTYREHETLYATLGKNAYTTTRHEENSIC